MAKKKHHAPSREQCQEHCRVTKSKAACYLPKKKKKKKKK